MAFSGGMGRDLTTTMRGLVANAHDISVDGPALPRLFQKIGREMIAAVALPFLVLMLAALGRQYDSAPAGVVVRGADAEIFEDFAGWPASSGCFPSRRWPTLAKGLIKIVLVGSVLTALMWPERGRLEGLTRSDRVADHAAHVNRWRSNCWARWSPCSRWWPPPTICSSTSNGTSGRKCRCGR